MKVGIRTPSLSKRISSRTTGRITRALKKTTNPLYGKKGMGLINNPRKAVYNKVYRKTTFDALKYVSVNNYNSDVPSTKSKEQTIKSSYTIINNNEVLFGKNKYTKKQLKFYSKLINGLAIFILLISLLILPVGILFIIFAIFLFNAAHIYKKIYKEMDTLTNID